MPVLDNVDVERPMDVECVSPYFVDEYESECSRGDCGKSYHFSPPTTVVVVVEQWRIYDDDDDVAAVLRRRCPFERTAHQLGGSESSPSSSGWRWQYTRGDVDITGSAR